VATYTVLREARHPLATLHKPTESPSELSASQQAGLWCIVAVVGNSLQKIGAVSAPAGPSGAKAKALIVRPRDIRFSLQSDRR